MKDLFLITSPVLPATARVVGFRGKEAISRLYRFDVGFTVPHGQEFDMLATLGKRASLNVDRDPGEPPFLFNGVIASLELVHEFDDRSLYLMGLAPLLWKLTLTHHSRVFTDGTIPEIIEAVLKHSGMTGPDYSLRLSRGYAKLDHVCQYRESNLDFISRLMEREGMYYYFEQGDGAEVLVISDHLSFQGELSAKPVRYDPTSSGDHSAGAALSTFKCKLSALPATVQLRDYDYVRPSLDVSGRAAVVASSSGDIVMYGENFKTPDEGNRLAKIRAEEYLAGQEVYHAAGRVFHLRPGYRFTLEDHPRAAFNAAYLTTEIDHQGNQATGFKLIEEILDLEPSDVYRVELKAIPVKVQFRAKRVTPWPRIDGVMDAVVDGAAGGPYAEIDSHGRYKVRIHFDESDLLDGSASTWVRMLQPHGGSPEGFHFPLRKGTEVHLVFLGGDPDRPVIVGVAHNSHKPSSVTAQNATQNVIMTGGSNRLEMEDTAGGQYATLSTPTVNSFLHLGAGANNLVANTDGNSLHYTGGNHDAQVIGDHTEDVTGAVKETYLSTQDTTVTGPVTQTYEATLDLTVTGAVTNIFESTLTETVTGAVSQTYEATLEQTVTGAVTQTFESTLTQTVTGAVTENYNGGQKTTIVGTHDLTATGAQTIHSDVSQTMTAPTQRFAVDGLQKFEAADHEVVATASYKVDGGPIASVKAADVTVDGSGKVTIKSGTINIEGGNITMSGGTLTVTHGAINITGAPILVDGGGEIGMTAGVIKLN
jgi:type VI secretion system secreted protein VgrG